MGCRSLCCVQRGACKPQGCGEIRAKSGRKPAMTRPAVLYHCTTVEALESIFSDGLLPRQSQSSLPAVFLSDCPHLASGYAGQRPDVEHVLLAIEFAGLDPALLGPDNYELQDWLDGQDDEHADLTGVTHWSEASWQQSLEWCNQVAYAGVIAASAISVVEGQEPVQMLSPGMGM